nr:MAG TPA: STOP protein [Caudoviricetes sp.]
MVAQIITKSKEVQSLKGWIIVGSQCGRDNKGTFRCLCGKCKKRGV